MNSLGINYKRLFFGALFLVAGTLEYLCSRPPGSAVFLEPFQPIIHILHDKINPYGKLGFLAPDFFHPLAFALLCMALLPDTLRNRIGICVAWLGIDAAFELAQKYGTYLSAFLPGWFENVPLLENLDHYITSGTFDVLDLLAITCGALTALLIGQLTKKELQDAT